MRTIKEQADNAVRTTLEIRDERQRMLDIALAQYPERTAIHEALRKDVAYWTELAETYRKQGEESSQ